MTSKTLRLAWNLHQPQDKGQDEGDPQRVSPVMAMDAAAVEKEGPPKHPHAVRWGSLGDRPGDPQVILGTFTLKSREVPRDHYSVGTRGLGVAECLDRKWRPGLGDH